MTDEPKGKQAWTAAERAALRKLIRMALIYAAGDRGGGRHRRPVEFGAGDGLIRGR